MCEHNSPYKTTVNSTCTQHQWFKNSNINFKHKTNTVLTTHYYLKLFGGQNPILAVLSIIGQNHF